MEGLHTVSLGSGEGEYSSSEEDAEVCVEFHEFDVLFTHAVLEHVAFVENTDLLLTSFGVLGRGTSKLNAFFRNIRSSFAPVASLYVVTMT